MLEFRIEPLAGIGPIRFGMSRSEVEATVGPGTRISENRNRYIDSLFVDFDADGAVEFIEAGESGRVTFVFDGANVHLLPVREAVQLFVAHAPYDQDDPELGYSFMFPDLQVALWRSTGDHDRFESVSAGRRGYYG